MPNSDQRLIVRNHGAQVYEQFQQSRRCLIDGQLASQEGQS
jgi:hypothetical protein